MKYLSLLLISSFVFAGEIPSAAQARATAVSVHDCKVATDVPIVWTLAKDNIIEAASHGAFSTTFVVTPFEEDAIHIVNQRLRALGFTCETMYSRWTHSELDVISWESK